jgi:hypothetical protein
MDVIACLAPFFPEDVVRCITSYLVMKIPRDDPRYIVLARHFEARRGKIRTLTWKMDGAFRGYLISFSHAPLVLLIQHPLPYSIMYQLQNMVTMEYTVIVQ